MAASSRDLNLAWGVVNVPFGVQSLRAAPASSCDGLDPIAICTIGGNQLCFDCCISESGGPYNGGTCDAAPGVCICTFN